LLQQRLHTRLLFRRQYQSLRKNLQLTPRTSPAFMTPRRRPLRLARLC
jgi:hypothetical protein